MKMTPAEFDLQIEVINRVNSYGSHYKSSVYVTAMSNLARLKHDLRRITL